MLLAVIVTGCTTLAVPPGSAGSIRLTVGGVVETIAFDGGPTFNMQITEKEVPKNQALFPHMFTIGKFNRVLGSGFTKRSNIYYEQRIDRRGYDSFEVNRRKYHIKWISTGWDSLIPTRSIIYRVMVIQTKTGHAEEGK